MMNNRIKLLAVCFIPCLSAPAFGATIEMMLDQPRTLATVASTDEFIISLQANRSACCTITASDSPLAHFRQFAGGAPYGITTRGKDSPPANREINFVTPARSARACFLAGDTATLASTSIVFSPGFNNIGSGTGSNVTVLCQNTALIGGYNTSVTDFNFLEILLSNSVTTDGRFAIDGSQVDVVLLIRDAVTGSAFRQRLRINSNAGDGLGRADVAIHDIVGPGKFGSIIINHSGPPGSITARLVQYKITSTNPLRFEPVLEQPFTPLRSQ